MTYSKRIFWPIVAAAVFVAGCSSGSTDTPATPPAVAPATPPATANATTPGTAADGAALFTTNCSKCHGPTGRAPKLAGMKLAVDEVTKTITDGKPPKMPAFKDRLKTEEIAAIAKYVSTL